MKKIALILPSNDAFAESAQEVNILINHHHETLRKSGEVEIMFDHEVIDGQIRIKNFLNPNEQNPQRIQQKADEKAKYLREAICREDIDIIFCLGGGNFATYQTLAAFFNLVREDGIEVPNKQKYILGFSDGSLACVAAHLTSKGRIIPVQSTNPGIVNRIISLMQEDQQYVVTADLKSIYLSEELDRNELLAGQSIAISVHSLHTMQKFSCDPKYSNICRDWQNIFDDKIAVIESSYDQGGGSELAFDDKLFKMIDEGLFDSAKAVCFGNIHHKNFEGTEKTVEDFFKEFTQRLGARKFIGRILTGVPFGHGHRNPEAISWCQMKLATTIDGIKMESDLLSPAMAITEQNIETAQLALDSFQK